MTQPHPFRYVATFRDHREAEEEFAAASTLHRAGLLGTFGAALITRDPSGEVWLSTRELPAERGAVLGALAGALLGRPLHLRWPAALLAGALAGAVLGHLRAGLPRRKLQRLAATLAPGEAAVVVVGESRLEEGLRQAGVRAARLLTRRREALGDINRQWREADGPTGS